MNYSRIFYIALTVFFSFALTSCNDDVFGIRGEGPIVEETRRLDSFTSVDLALNGIVYITPGTEQEIRIEAQRNILDILDTDVRGGKLKIDFDRFNVRRHAGIKIYITVPELTALRVSGSGDLYTDGPFTTDNFDIHISGSGKIEARDLHVNYLESSISGSGRLQLEGETVTHKMNISGSGNMYAFGLYSENAEARISGSGKCEVSAEKTLKANISGSGKVYYKGNPVVDVKTSGSGRVVNAN